MSPYLVKIEKDIVYTDEEAHLRKFKHEYERYRVEITDLLRMKALIKYLTSLLDIFGLEDLESMSERKEILGDLEDAVTLIRLNDRTKELLDILNDAIARFDDRLDSIQSILVSEKRKFDRIYDEYQRRQQDPQQILDFVMHSTQSKTGGIDMPSLK